MLKLTVNFAIYRCLHTFCKRYKKKVARAMTCMCMLERARIPWHVPSPVLQKPSRPGIKARILSGSPKTL